MKKQPTRLPYMLLKLFCNYVVMLRGLETNLSLVSLGRHIFRQSNALHFSA